MPRQLRSADQHDDDLLQAARRDEPLRVSNPYIQLTYHGGGLENFDPRIAVADEECLCLTAGHVAVIQTIRQTPETGRITIANVSFLLRNPFNTFPEVINPYGGATPHNVSHNEAGCRFAYAMGSVPDVQSIGLKNYSATVETSLAIPEHIALSGIKAALKFAGCSRLDFGSSPDESGLYL